MIATKIDKPILKHRKLVPYMETLHCPKCESGPELVPKNKIQKVSLAIETRYVCPLCSFTTFSSVEYPRVIHKDRETPTNK